MMPASLRRLWITGALIGLVLLVPYSVPVFAALTTNLIAFYELEANGTDSTGANTVAPGTNPTFGAGWVNNGADFEVGNSEYLTLADNAAMSISDIDFTVCAGVKLESKASNSDFAGKGDADEQEYALRYNAGQDEFQFITYTDGFMAVSTAADLTAGPSTGTQYGVCGGHDATNNVNFIRVCVGGSCRSTVTAVEITPTDSDAPFGIGRANSAFPGYADAIIDQVGFWKQALSDADIDTWWNGGTGITYATLTGGGAAAACYRSLLGVGC